MTGDLTWLALGAILAGCAVLVYRQFRSARQTYRPLSSRQPERRVQETPLGTEAIDMEAVGRANRRNEGLERGQTNWLGQSGLFGRTITDIKPMADDETYAARFHDAFQKEKSKD